MFLHKILIILVERVGGGDDDNNQNGGTCNTQLSFSLSISATRSFVSAFSSIQIMVNSTLQITIKYAQLLHD